MLGYMSSMVWGPDARTVIDRINLGLDGLFAAGVAPVDGKDVIRWLQEVLRRRVDVAATALVGAIDQTGLYVDDGHAPASVMAKHHAKLSGGEAAA